MRIRYRVIGCWERGLAYFSWSWYLYPDDWEPEDYTFDTLDDAKDAFVKAVHAQNDAVSNVHIIALMDD